MKQMYGPSRGKGFTHSLIQSASTSSSSLMYERADLHVNDLLNHPLKMRGHGVNY